VAYEDYWESVRAQLRTYRARKLREVHLWFDVVPESKKSSPASRIAFQKELAIQLEQWRRRRPFSVPVVVQMDFTASLVNPPSVHTLAKHYLDLLQAPVAGSGLSQRRLLLTDDRFVKVLICNYSIADGVPPGLSIRIATLNDFALNLELLRRVLHREFSDKEEWRSVHGWPTEDDEDLEREDFDDAVQDYRRDLSRKDRYIQQGGNALWEAIHWWSLRTLQEHMLNNREPHALQFQPIFQKRKKATDPQLEHLHESLAAFSRELLTKALVSVDLGSPAVNEGEGAHFREKTRAALAELGRKHKYMKPLVAQLGATILYLPPVKSNGIDLDNLARKVLPWVHEELKPPVTFLHGLKGINRNHELSEELRGHWEKVKRVPADQVTRYQVLEVPRTTGDPAEGSIKLILHSGAIDARGPWYECDEILRKWEHAVEWV